MMGAPLRIGDTHPAELHMTIGEGIIADIRFGLPKKHAAARAGVTDQSFFNWVARGKKHATRLEAFDTENPGALGCQHGWSKQKVVRCADCGVAQTTWDDLVTIDDREQQFLAFMREAARATAEITAELLREVRAAASPRLPASVEIPGDWKASVWMLERIDPRSYHLPTIGLAVDIDEVVDTDLDATTQQFLEELDAMGERMAANQAPE